MREKYEDDFQAGMGAEAIRTSSGKNSILEQLACRTERQNYSQLQDKNVFVF